jgi:hypothetical protein
LAPTWRTCDRSREMMPNWTWAFPCARMTHTNREVRQGLGFRVWGLAPYHNLRVVVPQPPGCGSLPQPPGCGATASGLWLPTTTSGLWCHGLRAVAPYHTLRVVVPRPPGCGSLRPPGCGTTASGLWPQSGLSRDLRPRHLPSAVN